MQLRAIIVEDEKLVAWSLGERLRLMNIESVIYDSGLKAIEAALEDQPDIVFVDYKLPDSSGLEVLESLQKYRDKTLFFFMTAYGTSEIAHRALELGATQYLTKPLNFDELNVQLTKALKQRELNFELDLLKQQEQKSYQLGSFISHSETMSRIVQQIEKLTELRSGNILLLGETGTGKDTVARLIHEQSPRAKSPFVIVNCASLSESLLESELFGHERGAFTDAKVRKLGHVEMADGGTIFLDEIGEVPIAFQAKLLRFLETQSFYRVGGTKELSVDVRIIAATDRNLEDGIKTGHFREDLYYRLNVISLELPPLRDRAEDIKPLTYRFIEMFCSELNLSVEGISDAACLLLENYQWPGNIRELKNVIERIFLLERPQLVEPWHLPISLRNASMNRSPHEVSLDGADSFFEGQTLDDIEKYAIDRALNKVGRNQSQAARLLDISRDQIRYKMKKYALK